MHGARFIGHGFEAGPILSLTDLSKERPLRNEIDERGHISAEERWQLQERRPNSPG
jgi:hypothetical protein